MPSEGCIGVKTRRSIGSLRLREEELHNSEEIDPSAEHQILLLNVGCCVGLFREPSVLFVCGFKRVNLLHW